MSARSFSSSRMQWNGNLATLFLFLLLPRRTYICCFNSSSSLSSTDFLFLGRSHRHITNASVVVTCLWKNSEAYYYCKCNTSLAANHLRSHMQLFSFYKKSIYLCIRLLPDFRHSLSSFVLTIGETIFWYLCGLFFATSIKLIFPLPESGTLAGLELSLSFHFFVNLGHACTRRSNRPTK